MKDAVGRPRGRLRGRIWQAEGHHEQAKLCFERAIARSRVQGGRVFKLNATPDLVKLGAERGDATEALEQLRFIVDWFPATLDSPHPRRMPRAAALETI